MSAAMVTLLGTRERIQNSRGRRAISVRATEELLDKEWKAKNDYWELSKVNRYISGEATPFEK